MPWKQLHTKAQRENVCYTLRLCFFFPPVLHCWRPLLMMMILCRVLSTRRQHPVLILVLHLILVLVPVLVLVS